MRSPSSSSLRTSRRVRQSTAPAEKPPSSPSRDCHGRRAPKGFEAATAEYEGERSRLLEPAPATAPLGKLPAETKQLLLSFDANQFVLPKGCKVPLYKLLERPGYLDLVFGAWCLTFDLGQSAGEDLLHRPLQARILELIKSGAICGVGGGPICSSFNRAMRSKVWPLGLPSLRPSMQKKVDDGNSHADFMAEVVKAGIEVGIPSWAENPTKVTFVWDTPSWKALLSMHGPEAVPVVDYGRFGTPWRKRTRIFAPGEAGLGGQRVLCKGPHNHVRLSGYSRAHRKQWTKVAEPYPRALNRLLAWYMINPNLPGHLRRRLDVAACARCHGARIGEATSPGPAPRPSTLESVELVLARTVEIQRQVLGDFQG